jgi:hypothetical protein
LSAEGYKIVATHIMDGFSAMEAKQETNEDEADKTSKRTRVEDEASGSATKKKLANGADNYISRQEFPYRGGVGRGGGGGGRGGRGGYWGSWRGWQAGSYGPTFH